MIKKLHSFMLLAVAACCLVLMPDVALAADLSCDSTGAPNANTEIFPSSGPSSPCANVSPIAQHIFSWIICSYVQILDSVLDNTYCSMQYNMEKLLAAVFTVYITVFGVQLLMGTAQLSVKEFVGRCIKISCVWLFVTDSTYGIGFAFDFFTTLAGEGTQWVLNGVLSSAPFQDQANNPDLYNLASNYNTSGGSMPIYGFLDQLVYNAVLGPLTQANDKITTFFIMCITLLPTIALLMGWYLLENFKIVARALISFMLGISALAFLISLSPIFLSFMLFSITWHLFDNWVKYMISFALQIIIIFACVGMWLAVTSYFIGFFDNLSDVLVVDRHVDSVSGSTSHINDWVALCRYTYNQPNPPTSYMPTVTPNGCESGSPQPSPWAEEHDHRIQVTNLSEEAATNNNPDEGFIHYLTANLLALLLITYAFSALLKQAPDIARQLAGPEYVPMIGQGMGFTRYGQLKGLSTARPDSSGKSGFLGSFFNKDKSSAEGSSSGSDSNSFIGQAMQMVQRRPDKS